MGGHTYFQREPSRRGPRAEAGPLLHTSPKLVEQKVSVTMIFEEKVSRSLK